MLTLDSIKYGKGEALRVACYAHGHLVRVFYKRAFQLILYHHFGQPIRKTQLPPEKYREFHEKYPEIKFL